MEVYFYTQEFLVNTRSRNFTETVRKPSPRRNARSKNHSNVSNKDGAKVIATFLVHVFVYLVVDAMMESRRFLEEFEKACFGGF